jgi:rubrerythrin
MSFLKIAETGTFELSRRTFLGRSGIALSATTVALLAGYDALAAGQKGSSTSPDNDVAILNSALGAELEAIAAYQAGAESGLLTRGTKAVALKFQGHHRAHADLLAATVNKLGGKAARAKSNYEFPTATFKNEADVLRFAAKLEGGAVSAYLGAVPVFDNRDLSRAAASILGDEAMHWAILCQVLGDDPVPSAFVG